MIKLNLQNKIFNLRVTTTQAHQKFGYHEEKLKDQTTPMTMKPVYLRGKHDNCNIDYCYKISYPATYSEGKSSPEAAQEKRAMDEEIEALNTNNTYL